MAQIEVPILPKELARRIVQLLTDQSCRDIICATLACKAFWDWGNALSFVEAATVETPRGTGSLASLLRFQSKRAPLGLKVEAMHLHLVRFGDMAAFSTNTMECVQKNVQLCCATLVELFLYGLDLGQWFYGLNYRAGSARSELTDAICQCKQLRSLHIVYQIDRRDDPPPDASGLLMEFSAALPNLTALHWRDGDQPDREYTRHIFDAFVDRPWMDRKAHESLAGPGLRLLQAEQCSFGNEPALPASLEICSLRSWDQQPPRLFEGLHRLLAPCAALRELYFLHFDTQGDAAASLDLPSIAATCPLLRVLVLHVYHRMQHTQWAVPYGKGEVILPNLEVLILIGLNSYTDELVLRAPALEVLAMDPFHIPNIAEQLLESAGASLRHLQLVMADIEPVGHPVLWYGLWEALKACTRLAALQLVFEPEFGQAVDQEVCRFLEAALSVGPLCLPSLSDIAIFLEEGGADPVFYLGTPLAPEQGAQGVCNALGRLVAAGVLPNLSQVLLYPCEHDFNPDWRGEKSAMCDGAPNVEVTCRPINRDDYHDESICALRMPEHHVVHLSKAAMRAYKSLELAPSGINLENEA